MNKFLLIFIICISLSAKEVKQMTADDRIRNLLTSEIKMIENVTNRKMKLSYRLLELYSEELALINKIENSSFLKNNQKIEKKNFFTKSRTRYYEIKKYGLELIKNNPKSSFIADIYYTLALNSRDFGDDKITQSYLNKSLELTSDKDVRFNATAALADHYYNEKKYKDAIVLYEFLIQNKKDEWLTKNTFNLSWCYLKVKKNELALNSILESYYLSKDKSYINIADQVFENLPLFYSINNKIQEGFTFFSTEHQEPARFILKMARKASENGDYAGGLYLINKSKELFNKKEQFLQLAQTYSFELEYYSNFKRWEKHFEAAQNIVALNSRIEIPQETKDEFINQLKEHTGQLQKKILRNNNSGFGEFEGNITKEAVQYFDFLIALDHINKYLYSFYQAETLFSAKRYSATVEYYKYPVEVSLTNRDPKILNISEKSLNALLFIIDTINEKQTKHELTYWTFESYIKIFQKSIKAQEIYPRFYSLNLKDNKFNESKLILADYNKNFPQDLKSQQEQYLQLVDTYIEKLMSNELAQEIISMKNGFLKMSNKYIQKTEITLGDILFKDYLKKENEGQLNLAIAGYSQLYHTDYYPNSIKARAGFNLAFANQKANVQEESFEWLKKSFILFEEKELVKNLPNALILSEIYFLKQNFNVATKANQFLLNTACRIGNDHKEIFYHNLIQVSLYNNEYSIAQEAHGKNKECNISKLQYDKSKEIIVNHLILFKKHDELTHFVYKNKNDTVLVSKYEKTLIDAYWTSFWDKDEKNKIVTQNRINQLKILGHATPNIDEHIVLISKIEKIEKLSKVFLAKNIWDDKNFNEEKFNASITDYLANIANTKKTIETLLNEKSPHAILLSYNLLAEIFKTASIRLKSLKINSEDENYNKSFESQMAEISNKIKIESTKYFKELKKLTSKKLIFSPYSILVYKEEVIRPALDLKELSRNLASIDLK